MTPGEKRCVTLVRGCVKQEHKDDEHKQIGVLITGAGRGIGKRLAIGFAARGARVGMLARSKGELDLANLEIGHSGGSSIRLLADVRDFEKLCAAIDRMKVHYGRVDVLICAAAVLGPIGPFAEQNPKEWREAVDVNLLGVMNSIRAVLPHMIENRSGKIIVLTCAGAGHARPHLAPYAATKAAVVRLVETLGAELAEKNIQINCMSPGGTYTSMTDEILTAGSLASDKDQDEARQVRLTGGASADKQMKLALFLASERSNHVTGRFFHVNDDWKKLENASVHPDVYTLRRVQKL